jgi:hypothetical protein
MVKQKKRLLGNAIGEGSNCNNIFGPESVIYIGREVRNTYRILVEKSLRVQHSFIHLFHIPVDPNTGNLKYQNMHGRIALR